jgi:hypothetical protein
VTIHPEMRYSPPDPEGAKGALSGLLFT